MASEQSRSSSICGELKGSCLAMSNNQSLSFAYHQTKRVQTSMSRPKTSAKLRHIFTVVNRHVYPNHGHAEAGVDFLIEREIHILAMRLNGSSTHSIRSHRVSGGIRRVTFEKGHAKTTWQILWGLEAGEVNNCRGRCRNWPINAGRSVDTLTSNEDDIPKL